jgi:hypothetical protein
MDEAIRMQHEAICNSQNRDYRRREKQSIPQATRATPPDVMSPIQFHSLRDNGSIWFHISSSWIAASASD